MPFTDANPVMVEHCLALLRLPVEGVAEIPDVVWSMEIFDIAGFLGLVACYPEKKFVGVAPKLVWDSLIAYLDHQSKMYEGKFGQLEECYRRARQTLMGDDTLWRAYQHTSVWDTITESAKRTWPLQNLTIEARTDG